MGDDDDFDITDSDHSLSLFNGYSNNLDDLSSLAKITLHALAGHLTGRTLRLVGYMWLTGCIGAY